MKKKEASTDSSGVPDPDPDDISQDTDSILDLGEIEGSRQSGGEDEETAGGTGISPGMKLGKYKVIETCGEGGMGRVYKVWDLLEEAPKAMKTVPDAVVNDEAALARLKKEIDIARKITHPNVVKVLDLRKLKGLYFLIMEYIDGEDLLKKVSASPNHRLKEYQVIQYMTAASLGLREIHNCGAVHQDLKPNNIMISRQDERVKILDFSLSEMSGESTRARDRSYMRGTLPYMAPEQFLHEEEIDHQTDIWALGVTVYYLLSGQFPFKNRVEILNPVETPPYLPHISAQTNHFIIKCLQKDKKNRYRDMDGVLEDLKKIEIELKKEIIPPRTETEPGAKNSREKGEEGNTSRTRLPPASAGVIRSMYRDLLGKEEVRRMIESKGFFDANLNKDGGGKNKFEIQTYAADRVVLDTGTGLMWHQSGSPGYMSLKRAKEWLLELNKSSYAGYSDWRLPTLEEAASLLQEKEKKDSFYISAVFSPQQRCIYTGDRKDEAHVWVVDFEAGNVYLGSPNYGYIRPVRVSKSLKKNSSRLLTKQG
jgi:serine/threonine protein kinase